MPKIFINNYILKNENAIFFEANYSCDNAIFLSLGSGSNRETFFITDSRYTEEAKNSVFDFVEVVEITKSLIATTVEVLLKNRVKSLIYDATDWNHYDFVELQKKIKTQVFLRNEKNFSKNKRIIKTDDEVQKIAKAVNLGKNAFIEFSNFLQTKENLTEKELHFNLKNILSYNGEYDLSFDPIVAINQNASKPHALPTRNILVENDLLLVDAGLKYERYCSDRTRTFEFNKNNNLDFIFQEWSNFKIQRAYNIVRKAHDKAIEKVHSGMKASEVDKIARDVVQNSEFKDLFIHSTGHGVGLDIHEFPNISSKSDVILEDNMIFTIEPGIYIPNKFGIRIEDMVVLKNGKPIVL
jgi:Xaa-Pro aminopeptidase